MKKRPNLSLIEANEQAKNEQWPFDAPLGDAERAFKAWTEQNMIEPTEALEFGFVAGYEFGRVR